MSRDAGGCSVLVLLDLSSAFDTVALHILIDRLSNWMVLSGSVLQGFSSYFPDRCFTVTISNSVSDPFVVLCSPEVRSLNVLTFFIIYLLMTSNFTSHLRLTKFVPYKLITFLYVKGLDG